MCVAGWRQDAQDVSGAASAGCSRSVCGRDRLCRRLRERFSLSGLRHTSGQSQLASDLFEPQGMFALILSNKNAEADEDVMALSLRAMKGRQNKLREKTEELDIVSRK